MTRGEDFIERGKSKKNHCSSMSNSAWCDLNSKGNILELHEICPNPKCGCEKIITFTPHQLMLEGGSLESKLQTTFRGTKTERNKFLKPTIIAMAPFIGMAVSAKTKNLKVGQASTNILKSITGGKILRLTELHGNGLRLRVM